MNEIIEDYFMNPRNNGEMDNPDIEIHVGNPVCGDTVKMGVKLQDNYLTDVLFKAYGCSTSIATASLLSEYIKNKSIAELEKISKETVADLLGELEPKQRHCIDIGFEIIDQLVTKYAEV